MVLTATLCFHFALSANLWFKPALDAWSGCIDLKGVMKAQLPLYGSNRCHIMAQVSNQLEKPQARNQGHVKVASIWSAGACSRFLGGQLAARPERASEQARRKRQQAAALQIRPDRHYPVILQLWGL